MFIKESMKKKIEDYIEDNIEKGNNDEEISMEYNEKESNDEEDGK